MAADPRVGKIL